MDLSPLHFNFSNMDNHMKKIEITSLKNQKEHFQKNFVNCLTGVKSANLIGTISENKISALSIVSSCFHLGANPALIGFISRPDSSPRHTLNNIRGNGILTINHVNSDIIEKAHQTSARYPEEISEFKECHLTEEYLDGFPAPFVKESLFKFSLKLVRDEKIKENNTHLIIAEVINIYFPENAIDQEGRIDLSITDSVGVAGLDQYYRLNSIGKLSYAKPEKWPIWLK